NLRPNQQFARINYLDSGGDSYYHSLQATMRKRFSAGLQAGAAYTLAKSIDDQSVDPVGASSGAGLSTTNSRTPTDTRNWRNERGRSDFDRRHVFTGNWVWELPFGKSGAVKQVIGGWSINGLFTAMSGEPFSVRSGARTSNNAHESRAAIIGKAPVPKLQPGRIGPVHFTTNDLCSDKVTTNCFAIPQPGDNGAGRNIFEAPGYWNLDLSVIKSFPLTERVRLQFRAEAFNALNHVNFDNPRDASVGSPSILSTQFGSACCAAVAPPSTQTIIQTGEAARVVQFAMKLQF
ncbi:MAG TPA: TonB-dependent receptor, partial [Bryobacteraceae bacterium]|nr:TonB-dependent receptor [Bryobacteraceae bacterium]